MSGNIKLNFINRSSDVNNSDILIYQRNAAEDFGEIAVAWRVIQNCGRLDNHPFNYPMSFGVSAEDSYGNYSPQLPALYGQAFEMVESSSGDVLRHAGTGATDPNTVEIRNNLTQGAINGNVYRDGLLVGLATNLAPGQKGVFAFKPILYIGVVSQVAQGEVLSQAILSEASTELDLFGISSADIVMTGGGSGSASQPFHFELQNIKMAP